MPQGNAEYRKIQELASGGMGSVELSRALSGSHAGEIVAVKRLHPHLEREKHFADMFFDEAWITAGLHHPNVVEIFDWGTDSVGRYLALEFVPGDSLLALIREAKKLERPIPLDLALFIIGKTAEGLHAAHELRNEQGQLRHLVHRDVTPSNVLVGLNGEVKLIDFGVAKARDKLSHTSTGTIKGKFGYMSPEQARGFPIDRRSDVFSLGVVLWETLALKRLYRSESELEILRMIVDDPPVPISTVRSDVPHEIENLLQGALAKNRDDRLGSCGEFAEFIWAIYHEHGYTAGERELARFFHDVMPERCASIEQLLSGSHDMIEPTIARPASGSFSGLNPQMVSGAIPLPRPQGHQQPPMVARPAPPLPPVDAFSMNSEPSVMATSYPAPQSEARGKSRTPVIAALAVVGIASLAGVGWMVGRGAHSTSGPATAGTNGVAPATLSPSAPIAPPAAAQTAAAPPEVPGTLAAPEAPAGTHGTHPAQATQTSVTTNPRHGSHGNTGAIVVVPPNFGANAGSAASAPGPSNAGTATTAAATTHEPSTTAAAHEPSTPTASARSETHTATAASGSSGGSGTRSSGTGSGTTSTGSGGSAPAGSGTAAPSGGGTNNGRIQLGRDWGG